MSPRELPVHLLNSQELLTGTETEAVTEFGKANEKSVVKEVDPLKFHLPWNIRQEAEAITDPVKQAVFVADYKNREYRHLAQVFQERIAQTSYVVLRSGKNIRIGVIQPKIEGKTIAKFKYADKPTPKILSELQKFLDLISEAKNNPQLKDSQSIEGYLPKAEELMDRQFEKTGISAIPELCNISNLIFDDSRQIVVAVDW